MAMGRAADEIDKRGERVRAMFASIASRYDLLNHVLSLNIDKSWRRFTVRTVPPSPGQSILDVCTGTGDLALAYARAGGDGVRVVGVDFCPPMLEVARKKAQAAKANVTFLEADAMALPFSSEFDIVTCAFGLRNIADTRQGLTELARVARPGGRVAVLEFSRPKVPVLRSLYLAYFKYLLPRIGQSVSRNDHGAYEYLPASVLAFPDGPEMVALMHDVGLDEVRMFPLTWGISTLYVGVKRSSSDASASNSTRAKMS